MIVKSGETYAAYWNGVDYLWTGKEGNMIPLFFHPINQIFEVWKSFTGPNPDITELTDEIAKLRPMVKYVDFICQLVHVQEEGLLHIYDKPEDKYHTLSNCRLATTYELKNKT